MPTARLGTEADAAAISTFILRVVNGATIRDELLADWGSAAAYTTAFIADQMRDVDVFYIMGFDDNAVQRGVAVFKRHTDSIGRFWEFVMISSDKRLTLQQRLAAFHFLARWIADNAPSITAQTRFYGKTKLGGNIDTYMQPRIANRTVAGDRVIYWSTAAEMRSAFT